ncbi:MAG: hypothetical protein JO034_30790 [Singulisphaera sp.]|nr:hypothetical protein [Singulisphaera sp.]
MVAEGHRRTEGRPSRRVTSDDAPASKAAILPVSGTEVTTTPTGRPGRRMAPAKGPPPELTSAPAEERRRWGRVVEIPVPLIVGTMAAPARASRRSKVSRRVNVSSWERYHATDRHRRAPKVRTTSTVAKDWQVHESMAYFAIDSYNFCWAVRTLNERDEHGRVRPRSPAMAAGRADPVRTMREWITTPAIRCA